MLPGRRGQSEPAGPHSQLCFPAAPAEMRKPNTCKPGKSHKSPHIVCKGQSTAGTVGKARGNHTAEGEMEGTGLTQAGT